jgi:amidase
MSSRLESISICYCKCESKNIKEVMISILPMNKADAFKQETLISSNEKKGLDDKNYIEALNKSHFGSRKFG